MHHSRRLRGIGRAAAHRPSHGLRQPANVPRPSAREALERVEHSPLPRADAHFLVPHMDFYRTARPRTALSPVTQLLDKTDMPRTVADQFAETLPAAGVKRTYGMTDAVRRQGKIEWIHLRHGEEAVGRELER